MLGRPEKFKVSPGASQGTLIRRPVEDRVRKAVRRLGPPKQMLVVRMSSNGEACRIGHGAITVIPLNQGGHAHPAQAVHGEGVVKQWRTGSPIVGLGAPPPAWARQAPFPNRPVRVSNGERILRRGQADAARPLEEEDLQSGCRQPERKTPRCGPGPGGDSCHDR